MSYLILLKNCRTIFNIKIKSYNLSNNLNKCYHTQKGVFGFKPFPNKNSSENPLEINNFKEYCLIEAYREHGHKVASLDPLIESTNNTAEECELTRFKLSPSDSVSCANLLNVSQVPQTIGDLVKKLHSIYCGNASIEFKHLWTEEERVWFGQRFEELHEQQLSKEEKLKLGQEMLKSQIFDKFLATKFVTVKRYGGEGCESMMGFFSELFSYSAQVGISDIVIGMPHRGRLNLLTGLLELPPVILFQKMKGMPEFPKDAKASGDVLSHITNCVDLNINDKKVHVSLLPNSSHLEAVSPIVTGKARGKLWEMQTGDYSSSEDSLNFPVLPVQVHGDAALGAQGIMMETLAFSNLPHFRTGGSVHLVVNNQIGFTTPSYRGRSSPYCTDIFKMIQAPVIHVNGDHPEEVIKATRLAIEYRQKFQKDVIIDLVCFRKWGHNEMDEPTFTNPQMYSLIENHTSSPDSYALKLQEEGVWNKASQEEFTASYRSNLNEHFKSIDTYQPKPNYFEGHWKGFSQAETSIYKWETGVEDSVLQLVAKKSIEVPEDFNIHPNLKKSLVNERTKKMAEGGSLDWATGETLALGSILYEGYNIRFCGQDVGRGTFCHRHAMLVDQVTNEIHIPLNHLHPNQYGHLEIANSLLSEEAVIGFEYGMSISSPHLLSIWEAQFGDFFNGAQIMFDAFVSSGESKWMLQSGLVILLPHGYDGAGPEHSSCRLERFLQMCNSKESGEDGDNVNWHIVNPSTPAQYFHLLRRQVLSSYRIPLIVVAPKMILRMPQATSTLAEIAPGTSFQTVLPDPSVKDASLVKKIIFCSGKHYYALVKERKTRNINDTAIIRLESLCPFPGDGLISALKKFPNVKEYIWSQEEHQNMGAWSFIHPRFSNFFQIKLRYAGRAVSDVPAVGVGSRHQEEIKHIFSETFK